MKKTWQWVIEFRRDIEPDNDYLKAMVEELLTFDGKEVPNHLLGYEQYIEWVKFTERMFGELRWKRSGGVASSEPMLPKHLNECLEVIACLANSREEDNYNSQTIKAMLKNAHVRIRNVKTGEVIPAEIVT